MKGTMAEIIDKHLQQYLKDNKESMYAFSYRTRIRYSTLKAIPQRQALMSDVFAKLCFYMEIDPKVIIDEYLATLDDL